MAKYANPSDKRVRKIVYEKYDGKCAYCGTELFDVFTIDHIIPKRRNMDYSQLPTGKDEIENYNPCCYSCNSSKSSFSIEKWRGELQQKYERLLKYDGTFRLLVRFGIVKRVREKVIFHFENP